MIVSNHQDAESLASVYKIPFHFFATTSDNKMEIEQCESDWFRQNKCRSDHSGAIHADLVIPLCGALPAENQQCAPFVSSRLYRAKPYHAAFDRGVTLIGATSHYVSEILDDGPIIDQDVTRVSHRDQIEELVQKGRDVERMVLSRAVRWHLDHRILRYANKTVVFD